MLKNVNYNSMNTIEVEQPLYEKLQAAWKVLGGDLAFAAFVQQVMQQGLEQAGSTVYKPTDEQEIEDRLRALGYLD